MTLEEDIQSIRKKIEAAKTERARREALADQARATHQAALASLKKLGFDSPEAALEEAQKLRKGLTETVADIETKLAEASA